MYLKYRWRLGVKNSDMLVIIMNKLWKVINSLEIPHSQVQKDAGEHTATRVHKEVRKREEGQVGHGERENHYWDKAKKERPSEALKRGQEWQGRGQYTKLSLEISIPLRLVKAAPLCWALCFTGPHSSLLHPHPCSQRQEPRCLGDRNSDFLPHWS